jgi:hypothetical protein
MLTRVHAALPDTPQQAVSRSSRRGLRATHHHNGTFLFIFPFFFCPLSSIFGFPPFLFYFSSFFHLFMIQKILKFRKWLDFKKYKIIFNFNNEQNLEMFRLKIVQILKTVQTKQMFRFKKNNEQRMLEVSLIHLFLQNILVFICRDVLKITSCVLITPND